jgi:hypothetical protein
VARVLEEGDVLLLGPEEIPGPTAEDRAFLRDEVAPRLSLKNVSYHPRGAFLSGVRADRACRLRTAEILDRHRQGVVSALAQLCPTYAAAWTCGKVNYRPLEEAGRDLPRRSSNEYLHVDAFASGATHGARVLRVFTNLHDEAPRIWRSAGRFDDLWPRYAEDLVGPNDPLRGRLSDAVLNTVLRALDAVGVGPAHLLETSAYDRLMRRFHNALKHDDELDEMRGGQVEIALPPGHSWVVFTDAVSHAVARGCSAVACTFHVPLQACLLPHLAPINVIRDYLDS